MGGIAVGGLRKPGMRATLEQTGIAQKKKEDPSTVGRNRKVGEIPSLSFVYIRKMRR